MWENYQSLNYSKKTKQNQLDLSGFENGIYYIKIETNSGISIKKVVKQD